MLAPSRARPSLYALIAIGVVAIFLYLNTGGSRSTPKFPIANYSSGDSTATNATLGFGGLWAVSGPGSPRRNHLEQAAQVTGLELTIPAQPIWSEEDVDNFKWPNKSESEVTTGTVKAWLSHHVVLREFLKSGQETALIFEDDIDWDIRLKSIQVPLAQRAARSLGSTKNTVDPTLYPWGSPKDWDLLYLGHCGDYLNMIQKGIGVGHHHPGDLERLKHVLYEDPTMLNHTDLHPFTSSFLTALTVPERTRVLHHSVWPLCTFGYAITRATAQRLLTDLAPPKEGIHKHITAYDAAILTACRDNHILCYTLQPELFHHMEGESLIAGEEAEPVHRPPVDEAGLEQVKWRKETSNIGCGFWSGEFYPEGDQKRLAYLQKEVVGKGKCLKPPRHL